MLAKIIWMMAIIIAVISGTFYWYYNHTQERIEQLVADKTKLETASQICADTVDKMAANQERLETEITNVNEEFAAIRRQNSVLAGKLEKHDIGVLGAAKPELVVKIINGATDKATRCIEIISGADLTEKEQNAATGKQFNSECPWLWPGAKK